MTTELSNRAKVRLWVRERIQGEEEVSLPELANEAIQVLGGDRKFITAFANECLHDMVLELASQVIKQTRGLIKIGDVVTDVEGVKRRARKQSVFANWLEHVGDRHVRLLDMTREDLLSAADERQTRGERELEVAALWRTLAQRLEGGQAVKDRFSAEEIEGIQRGLLNS